LHLSHTATSGASNYGLVLIGTSLPLLTWGCCAVNFRLPLLSVLNIVFQVVALDDGSIIARSGGFRFSLNL
jgi:hypothetical protein